VWCVCACVHKVGVELKSLADGDQKTPDAEAEAETPAGSTVVALDGAKQPSPSGE